MISARSTSAQEGSALYAVPVAPTLRALRPQETAHHNHAPIGSSVGWHHPSPYEAENHIDRAPIDLVPEPLAWAPNSVGGIPNQGETDVCRHVFTTHLCGIELTRTEA